MLKKQPRLFWIGLLLYVVSFFLVATVGDLPEPATGYRWALIALMFPFALPPWQLPHTGVFEQTPEVLYVSIVLAGLVNVMFLVAVMIASFGRHRRLFLAFRAAVFICMPFCWI